jgi:hypothetical protein
MELVQNGNSLNHTAREADRARALLVGRVVAAEKGAREHILAFFGWYPMTAVHGLVLSCFLLPSLLNLAPFGCLGLFRKEFF